MRKPILNLWIVFKGFKGELHSNSWNLTFVNKLQFRQILRSFVLTVFLNDCFKTMRIFAWFRYLQKLASFRAIHRFIFNFFANQNFSWHRKVELLRKWIAVVLQVKLRKRPRIRKQRVVVSITFFTKQPSAERYLANIFSPVFFELLENSSNASKYLPKSFRNFTKIHPWRSLMLVKLQAFTGLTTRCVL